MKCRFKKTKNETLLRFLKSDKLPIAITGLDLSEVHKRLLDANFKYIPFEKNQIPYIISLLKELYPQLNDDKELDYHQVREFDLDAFKEATGYELYEVNTVEDFEKFKIYYKINELLCSFKNIEDRLKRYKNVFLVHQNWQTAKRSESRDPYDEYSLSVLLLQNPYSKSDRAQIISRYNHSVKGNRPNDLYDYVFDKIYPGLSHFMGQDVKEVLEKKRKEGMLNGNDYIIKDKKIYKWIKEKNGRQIFNAGYEFFVDKRFVKINPDYQMILQDEYIYCNKNKAVLEVTCDGLICVIKAVLLDDIVIGDVNDINKVNSNSVIIGDLKLIIKIANKKICRAVIGNVYSTTLKKANAKLFDVVTGAVEFNSLRVAKAKLFDTACSVFLNSLEVAKCKLFDNSDKFVELNSLEMNTTKLFDTAGYSVYLNSMKAVCCKLFNTAGSNVYLESIEHANTKLFDSCGGNVWLNRLKRADAKLFDIACKNVYLEMLEYAGDKLFDEAKGKVYLGSLQHASCLPFDKVGGEILITRF